jgi:tetratricopeptide (TPR) repeat protein
MGAAIVAAVLAPVAAGADGRPPLPVASAQDAPRERAVARFNDGVKHRERAGKAEGKAARASKPKDEARHLERARREYEQAATAFREAGDLDPTLHPAFTGLGHALRKLGDPEASVAAYDRALGIEPASTEAIEYRGEAFLQLDRVEEAQAAYMALFSADRPRAAQLLGAMRLWVETRTADPRGVDAAVVEAVGEWVALREELAAQTPAPGAGLGGSW